MMTEGHIFTIKTKDESNVADVKNGGSGIVITGLNVLRDQIAQGDFVFVVFGGDKPKGWTPGLVALAHISKLPYVTAEDTGKNFRLEIDVDIYFDTAIKRGDLVTYPDTFDTIGIGPITKWEPNQAITSVSRRNAIGLIQAICDLVPNQREQVNTLLRDELPILSRPVRRYVIASSAFGASETNTDTNLQAEFRDWMVKVAGKSEKTAKDTANVYVKSISDEYQEPTIHIWHGLREALYGQPAPVKVYELNNYAELQKYYAGIANVLGKDRDETGFNRERYSKCWDWAHSPANHHSISAGWTLFTSFMKWRDAQNCEALNKVLASGARIWTYSPGVQASKFDELTAEGEMALNFSRIPNLEQFEDAEDLRVYMQHIEGDTASHKNDVLALMNFRDVIRPGDYVFAKKGMTTYVGVGKIVGEYFYDEAKVEFKHRRKIDWFKIEEHELEDKRAAMKTLTDVTRFRDFVASLWKAFELGEAEPKPPIEEPEPPRNVDRLAIALRLFQKARQNNEEIALTKENVKALFLEYLNKNPDINEQSARSYVAGLDRGLQVKSGLETVVREGIQSRSLFEIIDADEFAAEANRIMSCSSFAEFESRYHVKHIYKHYLAFLRSKHVGSKTTNTDNAPWGCLDVRNWFATYSQDDFKDEFSYFRSRMIWSKFVRGQIGNNYEHVAELGELLAELKDSPRPIGYYTTDEFKAKCPEGIGIRTVTDFLMKFHPDSYISFTDNTLEALKSLGMWELGPKCYVETRYNELIGYATQIRNRMVEMGIGQYATGKDPKADYLTVNEFLWWANEKKDLIKEKIMSKKMKKPNGSLKEGKKTLQSLIGENVDSMMSRLTAALLTKPFAILAGASGTGKSRMVRQLSFMTCLNEDLQKIAEESTAPGNYCLVQVKPNWHDSSDLLGYRSAINEGTYVTTDFVKFVLKAHAYPNTPFFVCLDEMNLAPVEQYFAEFLSASEDVKKVGGEWVSAALIKSSDFGGNVLNLEPEYEIAEDRKALIEKIGLFIPHNLFVVGTVNMDDTTCQFSRKVLDRAMTIEMNDVNLESLIKKDNLTLESMLLKKDQIDLFVERKDFDGAALDNPLGHIFVDKIDALRKAVENTPFAIAYRFAKEAVMYRDAIHAIGATDEVKDEVALDHMAIMKILPRLIGTLSERADVLGRLTKFFEGLGRTLSRDKLERMKDDATKNGDYISFWP